MIIDRRFLCENIEEENLIIYHSKEENPGIMHI
jgi:hypothetical protein